MELLKHKFFIKFELRWKNRSWNGPQKTLTVFNAFSKDTLVEDYQLDSHQCLPYDYEVVSVMSFCFMEE